MKRLNQTVKLLMAFFIGYLFSFITNAKLPKENCSSLHLNIERSSGKCPVCKLDKVTQLQKNNLCDSNHTTALHKRFKPRTKFEVLQYDYFERKSMYNLFYENPKHGLLGHEKADITDVINQVLSQYNTKYRKPEHWRLKQLHHGHRRLDPLRGEEINLFVELISNKKERKKMFFEVVKPFNKVTIVKQRSDLPKEKIYFIVPLANRVDRFEVFIQKFEQICLRSKENVALLLVLFNNKSDDETSSRLVKNVISHLKSIHTEAELKIIETQRKFSRGFGLDLGIQHITDGDLVYFCDVDVIITRDFLTRCRVNAIKNEQVYYPIVFAQYDPDIVKNYSPKNTFKSTIDITKYTGHWVHYAFGMVCMYKADYVAVGGFDLTRQGWGGEDNELYIKHVKSNINVFRAMDPGLIHIYHPKYCDVNLTPQQYEMCILSASEGIGSKQQLGKLLLYGNRTVE